jgi:hypothetical protein
VDYGHDPIEHNVPPNYAMLSVSVVEKETLKIKEVMHDLRFFYSKYVKYEAGLVS